MASGERRTACRKAAEDAPSTPPIIVVAMLTSLANQLRNNMVNAFRNTFMAVAFIAVATVSILWDFNSYVASGLALVASFASGYCVERAFIKWSS